MPDDRGNLFVQEWEPSRENIEEARIVFDRHFPTVLVDPPVVRCLSIHAMQQMAISNGVSVPMEVARRGEIKIVWYGPPGPEWEPLPGNTCRPGEYTFDSVITSDTRSAPEHDDAWEQRWESGQPLLNWPHQQAMPWLGTVMDAMTIEEMDAALNERYTSVGQSRLSEIYAGQLDDVVAAYREVVGRIGWVALHSDDPGDQGTEHQVTDRRRIHIDPTGIDNVEVSFICQTGTVAWISLWDAETDGQLIDRTRLDEPYTVVANAGQVNVHLAVRPEIAVLLPSGHDNQWRAYTINEIRQREGLQPLQPYSDPATNNRLPARRPRSGDIKPEQEVVDEIDRLVNEQIRPGPRDDYAKPWRESCELCGEQWHGLPGTGGQDSYGHPTGAKGCPGAFADEDEIIQWRRRRTR